MAKSSLTPRRILTLGCATVAMAAAGSTPALASGERESNNTKAEALAQQPALAGGQTWTGTLFSADDIDMWPLHVGPSHHQVALTLDAQYVLDGYLYGTVYDEEGDEVKYVTVESGEQETLSVDLEGPASYYFAVESSGFDSVPDNAPYTFTVIDALGTLLPTPFVPPMPPPSPPPAPPVDTPAIAPGIEPGLTVTTSRKGRTVTVRARTVADAKGAINVKVRNGARKVSVRNAGNSRTYRFTVRRGRTYRVTATFTGRDNYGDGTARTTVKVRR